MKGYGTNMLESNYCDLQAMYEGCVAEAQLVPLLGVEGALGIESFQYDYEFSSKDNKLGSAYPAVHDNPAMLAMAEELDPEFRESKVIEVEEEATANNDQLVGDGPTPTPKKVKIPSINADAKSLFVESVQFLKGRNVNLDYVRGMVPKTAKMHNVNLLDRLETLSKKRVKSLSAKEISFMNDVSNAVKQYKTAAAQKTVGTLPKISEAPGVGLRLKQGGRIIGAKYTNWRKGCKVWGQKHPKLNKAVKIGKGGGISVATLAAERAVTYFTSSGPNGSQVVEPDSGADLVTQTLKAPQKLAERFKKKEAHLKQENRSNYHSNVVQQQVVTSYEFVPIYANLAQRWCISSSDGCAAGWFLMFPKGIPVEVSYPPLNDQRVAMARTRINAKAIGGKDYVSREDFFLDYNDDNRRTAVGVTVAPIESEMYLGPVSVKLLYGYITDKSQGIITEECIDVAVSGNSTAVTVIIPVSCKGRVGTRFGLMAGSISSDFTDVQNWSFLPCNTRSPYLR